MITLPTETEADVIARRAITEARRHLSTWEKFARVISRNPKLQMVLSATDNKTDGKKIWIKVPVELGESLYHDRALCGKRDEDKIQRCPSCHQKEKVFTVVIHEVAHAVFETYMKMSDKDKEMALAKALDSERDSHLSDKSLAALTRAVQINLDMDHGYYSTAAVINPYMGMIMNVLEDVRVNTEMQAARQGTVDMFSALYADIFKNGSRSLNGSVSLIGEGPINFQMVMGVYCYISGYDLLHFLDPQAVEDLKDEQLCEIMDRVKTARSVRDVYRNAFPLLKRMRELGYLLTPDANEEEPDSESEENDVESDDDDGSDSSDAEPNEDSSEGESDTEDKSDAGSEEDSSGDSDDDDEGFGDNDDGEECEDLSDPTPSEPDDDSPDLDSESEPSDGSGDEESQHEESDDESDSSSDPSGNASADPSNSAGSEDSGSEASDSPAGDSEQLGDSHSSSVPKTDSFHGGEAGGPREESGEEPGMGEEPRDDSPGYSQEDQEADGTPDEVEKFFKKFSGHGDEVEEDDEIPTEVAEALKKLEEILTEAIEIALNQMDYFEAMSRNISGVKICRPEDKEMGWAEEGYADFLRDVEINVPESILSPSLNKLRLLFTENRARKNQRNLKKGKLNTRALAKKIPVGDDRIFRKRVIPSVRSHEVVIGLDVSGSTSMGDRLKIIKEGALAKGELLNRLGIPFSMYAHSGSYDLNGMCLAIMEVKTVKEAWGDVQRQAVRDLISYSANIDGHTLEFYRKIIQRSSADQKLILYYTDGDMPAENYSEELEILQREIAICRQLGIELVGVGVKTDSPKQHGLDTVILNGVHDVPKVIDELRERLSK